MSAPRIESKIDTGGDEFRARYDHNRALAQKLRADVAEAAKGGTEKSRERHVARGKLLPAIASSDCSILGRHSWRSDSSPRVTCSRERSPALASSAASAGYRAGR